MRTFSLNSRFHSVSNNRCDLKLPENQTWWWRLYLLMFAFWSIKEQSNIKLLFSSFCCDENIFRATKNGRKGSFGGSFPARSGMRGIKPSRRHCDCAQTVTWRHILWQLAASAVHYWKCVRWLTWYCGNSS